MSTKGFVTTIIVIIIIILGLRYISGEDVWICENGEWIQHGNPSSPMPTSECK